MATLSKLTTINEVEAYRKQINEECDERLKAIALDERLNSLRNSSFGFIKESFEALAPSLFSLPKGKSLIAKYTKTIKENKNLSDMYSLHESVRKAHNGIDVDFFIDEITAASNKFACAAVKEDCKMLGNILAEAYKIVGDDAESLLPASNKELESAMSFISENKKDRKNIIDYSKSIKVIKEHIMGRTANDEAKAPVKDIDEYANGLMENFMSTYSNSLSEQEMAAIAEISESKNKEKVFEKYKTACINKLTEAKETFINEGKNETAEKLSSIMEQVSSKAFCEKTIGIDIYNLLGITNSI